MRGEALMMPALNTQKKQENGYLMSMGSHHFGQFFDYWQQRSDQSWSLTFQ